MSHLSNSSNISKYPCGTCDCTVTWDDRGVACESCGMWYHAHCQSISSNSYKDLQDSNISWRCVICGNPNYSNVSFDLFGVEVEQASPNSKNSSLSLDPTSPTTNSFNPYLVSTPTRVCKQNKLSSRPLRLVNINFRSARGKKPAIINMINSVQPDIIIGTESHLDADINDTEFLPSNYKTHRKDRNKYGGGGTHRTKR